MTNVCPRCGALVHPSEANHEYRCLEGHLTALYNLGVQRGLAPESGGQAFDEQAAVLIGRALELAWEWRAASKDRRPTTTAAALQAMTSGSGWGAPDLDTQVARFLEWQNIGWIYNQPVSGEAAWHDRRTVRRRYSERLEDALPLMQHPLLRPYELVRIHRLMNKTWEWHVARKDRWGTMETLVTARSAPLAICRAVVRLSGMERRELELG